LTARARAAGMSTTTENIAEDIAKDILEIIRSAASATESAKTTGPWARPATKALLGSGMTELILGLAFFFITEDFVSFGNFFEFFFGFFIAGIFVRMKFHRELTVSFFQLVLRSRARNF
jgi:hypothetical protein